MKKLKIIIAFACVVALFIKCNKNAMFADEGYDDRLSGGMATVFDETSKAFTHSIDGLNTRDAFVHETGDKAFEVTFVADSIIFTGKGPIYNNVSCISCHHNDGKGTPTAGYPNSSLLFRVSLPGTDGHGAPLSVPGFGFQLQDRALIGIQPEAHIDIQYNALPITYPDGTVVSLRHPAYAVQSPYITMSAGYLLSPRLAPPVFGLGLLENIPESTLLTYADENDANGDGISGRPNYIFDTIVGKPQLGRFGLKANTATIERQVTTAYQQDMGITSSLLPTESSKGQLQDNGRSGHFELPDSTLKAVVFYIKTLAVPARRNVKDPTNLQGEALFNQLKCGSCHRPTIQTGVDIAMPALSNQRIHPYTDLLLHDMGPGLADNRPDFMATGQEWRTMPLWGIGLFERTNGIPYFLHDGRARSIEEAILWHDGEAAKSKHQFMQLSRTDRNKLIAFLKSL